MADEKVTLDSAADDYLRTVPGLKYPQALVDGYPRIVNKVFELKDNKKELFAYFESLTNDTRGKRAGFDFSVLMNIQDLREIILGDNTGFVLDDTTKWVS